MAPPADDDQRREHVRATTSRRCAVRMRGGSSVSGELVDLSGTGCAFVVGQTELEIGDRGTVTISFEDWTLEADFVVRFLRPQTGGVMAGVSFENLLRTEVDRVVREVFVELRRRLQTRRQEP